MLFLVAMCVLSGCAEMKIRSNAAVCRVEFDYTDPAISQLNVQNLRALVSFKQICR